MRTRPGNDRLLSRNAFRADKGHVFSLLSIVEPCLRWMLSEVSVIMLALDINKQEAASEMKQPAQHRPAKKENFTFPHRAKPLVKAFQCHISTKCPKRLFLLPASELKAPFYSTHLTDMRVQGAEISVNVPSITFPVHQQILFPVDGRFYENPLTCFSPRNTFLQLPWCGAHHLSQIKVKR